MNSLFINKVLLLPYYLVLKTRHYLYDKGIFKSQKFDIPILVIGNISAGGTGKTPHAEFFIDHFSKNNRVALLSRGYGRKTKGFRYVSTDDGAKNCGDEPLQIKRKFPNIIVAVDANRVRGINTLLALPQDERPQLIIMDDAFQHRRVIASHNILLIDYSRPPHKDNLLPFGLLRDLPSAIYRADTVIITNSPPEVTQSQYFKWERQLRLSSKQRLLFSAVEYLEAQPVFAEGDKRYVYSNFAQLVTAIANPKHLELELSSRYKVIKKLRYRDHKNFTKGDLKKINSMARQNPKSVIITTEKDSQRLFNSSYLSHEARLRLFYFPIKIKLLGDQKESIFDSISNLL